MKTKLKLFLPLVLICSMFFGSLSFAAEEWTIREKADYYLRRYMDFNLHELGWAFGMDVNAELLDSYREYFKTTQPWEDGISFEDYVGSLIDIEGPKDNPTTIYLEPQIINEMNMIKDDYIEAHPQGYSYMFINGPDAIPSSIFNNPSVRDALLNAISSCPSEYILFPGANYNVTDRTFFHDSNSQAHFIGNYHGYVFLYPKASYRTNLNLISNNITDISLKYIDTLKVINDWSIIPFERSWNLAQYWEYGYVDSSGNVSYGLTLDSSYSDSIFNMTYLKNSSTVVNSPANQFECSLFSSSGGGIRTVFSSVDYYKTYDSGQPSPYYFTSGYKGSGYTATNGSLINSGELQNSGSLYGDVVNSVQSGMSGEEVIQLVDTLVSKLPSGGGSGGGSDDDSGGGSTGIGGLIEAIFGFIGELISGIVKGLTDLLDNLTGVITLLMESFTGGVIFEFLKAFMTWLPEPIPTLLTTLFVLTVIFAVVKLIKGVFT